jgi:hypothetical protein
MLDSEDTTQEEETNKHGDSIENPTLLQIRTGKTTHLILPAMEMVPTLEYKEPIQDGGKCSR